MKRTRLGPGKAALARGSTFKPRAAGLKRSTAGRRPPSRPARSDQAKAGSAAWKVGLGPCAMCGSTHGVQGHHAITRQELRHVAAEQGLDADTLLWDLRNRLALCEDCHASHHARSHPVPLTVLFNYCPDVFDLADEIDRSWWLERTYPDT